jgi:hypothetical protein
MAKAASEKVKIWVLPRNAVLPETDPEQNRPGCSWEWRGFSQSIALKYLPRKVVSDGTTVRRFSPKVQIGRLNKPSGF